MAAPRLRLFDGRVRLGIAPIGWVNDDMPELGGHIPFEQIIREAAEAGFEGTEVGNKYPRDPATLRAALAPHGLSIASAWFSTLFTTQEQSRVVEDFRVHMEFLRAMGCKVVVVAECGHGVQGNLSAPVLESKPVLDDAGWRRLTEGLNAIGRLAQSRQMSIVYHHHMGTVVQDRADIDRLMANTDPCLVHLLADTGHITFAGGDAVALVRDYASRIRHVHLKDLRADVLRRVRAERMSFLQGVREGVFTVPGDGMIDFVPVIAALHDAQYEGWFVVEAEQDPDKANPLVYAKKAHAYISRISSPRAKL